MHMLQDFTRLQFRASVQNLVLSSAADRYQLLQSLCQTYCCSPDHVCYPSILSIMLHEHLLLSLCIMVGGDYHRAVAAIG